jgi:hypothetical protein
LPHWLVPLKANPDWPGKKQKVDGAAGAHNATLDGFYASASGTSGWAVVADLDKSDKQGFADKAGVNSRSMREVKPV